MRRKEIERLLPGVMQRTLSHSPLLRAYLEAMAALHAPSERVLDGLATHFDPRRAPDAFVPFLAQWVDLTIPVTTGLGRMREWVASAVELSQWRGTARGLLRYLEVATAATGFHIEERVPGPDGRPRPFHLRITAPAAVAAHQPMVERIIELEKPAYVTYELVFEPAGGS